MKQFYLFLLPLLFPAFLFSQNISVKSFRALPTDLDARITFPKRDQNGDKCAIIKVVTTETDFTWDGDMFGIIAAEKKTGEYWLYLPHGAKRLTIKHEKIGVLQDYEYPEPILEATVYELELSVEEAKTQWLMIVTEPENAKIFIDGKDEAIGFYKKMHKPGTYHYRVQAPLYHPDSGTVVVSSEKGNSISISLKINYGFAQIVSLPKKARVIIDGIKTNLLSPCTTDTLISGEHNLSIVKWGFQPLTQKIIIRDGKTEQLSLSMESNRSLAKDLFRKRVIPFSVGYHNTTFLKNKFMLNSKINKGLGYAATFYINPFPIFIEFTYFSMQFSFKKNSEWYTDNNNYKHRGIQLSASYFPFPFPPKVNFYPYFGGGFEYSTIKGKTDKEYLPLNETDHILAKGKLKILGKAGVKVKVKQFILFGEYKRTFISSYNSYASSQIYSGIGLIF